MQLLVVQVSLLFVLVHSQHQLNQKCKTPSGYDGTCILIKDCSIIQPIIVASRNRNTTARQLARAYQCGNDGQEVLVCCDDVVTDNGSVPFKPYVPIREPIDLPAFNSPDLPNRTICGKSPPTSNKIYGGEATELGEFPWTAAIEYIDTLNDNRTAGIICGGVLINNKWVLTAAHCIIHQQFQISKVRLGEWDINKDPDCYIPDECADKVQIFDVEKQITHEYYRKQNSNNDVGLLKLNRDIPYTKYIQPICLPPPDLELAKLQSYMTVVGWGLTENGITSSIKLKVDVPLLSNRECQEKIGSRIIISKNHYCAGGEEGKDSCRGDSGGPLMRSFKNNPEDDEQWYLEGIVGSGISCGLKGKPGIYLRITSYTGWIIRTLAEEKQNES